MLGIDNSALESRARALIGDRSLPAVNCSASPGFRRIRTELDRLGAARGGVVDWELVAREGARLLREEAHDVRVACFVARALSEREGLIGLAVGVTTLRLLITERAETLWPPAARARGRAQALESLLDGVTARIVDDPGEDPEGAAALAWAVVELARAARAVDSIWEELLAPFTRVVNRLVERAGITGGEHVHASADQGRSARARESGGSSSARESGGTRSTSDAFGHGQATSLPVDAARSQEAPANPDTLSRSAGVCSSEARSRGAAAGSAAATVDDDPRAPLQLVDDHPEPRAEHGDGGGASRGCDQDMSDPRVQERRAIDDGMKQTVAQPDEAAHGDGSQPIAGTLETPQRPRDGAADGAELVVPASADRRGASNRGGDHRTTSERALRAASQQEDRGAEDGGDAAYDEASTRATGSETNARDPRVPGVAGHESAGDDREAQRSVLRGAHDRGVRSILEIAQQLRRVDPRDPRGYRYARIALWSLTWQAVPSSGRVAVPSLPDGIRAHLAGLMTARRFPELVADAEATVVRYRYSLDLQRWIVLGLAGSGRAFESARLAVIDELSGLLTRSACLLNARTQDGQALADPETRRWVADKVVAVKRAAPKGDPSRGVGDDTRERFTCRLERAARALADGRPWVASTLYAGVDRDLMASRARDWEPALVAACLEGLVRADQTLDPEGWKSRSGRAGWRSRALERLGAVNPEALARALEAIDGAQ